MSQNQENAAPADVLPNYAVADPILDAASAEELNAAFSSLNISEVPLPFPTADNCLAHLKLLHAFHALKEDIGYTDGIFGLWDSRVEVYKLEDNDRDQALAKTREKRWAVYLARAVERFEEWWANVLCPREGGRRIEGKEMVEDNPGFTGFPSNGKAQKWTTEMLPPIGMSISTLFLPSFDTSIGYP